MTLLVDGGAGGHIVGVGGHNGGVGGRIGRANGHIREAGTLLITHPG